MFQSTRERVRIKIFLTLFLTLVGMSSGCKSAAPEADPVLKMDAINKRMLACLPPRRYRGNDGDIRIAINGLSRLTTETKVRIVGYAGDNSGAFNLPVYSLSRGRWLISNTGRAFLIDQDCRQYRLTGRKSSTGRKIPQDGRIELQPGQSFESDLSFPRLADHPYILILVYGDLILPLPPLPRAAPDPEPRPEPAAASGN